jgi:pimeloyl-ACP methyl ester carboxylesterase
MASSKIEENYKDNAKKGNISVNQRRIATYQWGDKDAPKVVLVHGWEGRATQLYKFIEPILENGFCVVAFDGPAHGDSEGKQTTLSLFADALTEVCNPLEDIRYVIAHSFGCGAAAIAINNGLKFEKAAFISSPYSVENVVNNFGKFLRIPKKVVSIMHTQMETKDWHDMPRDNLSFVTLGQSITFPTLFVHDENDKYVPFEDGILASETCNESSFFKTEKLGHNKILLRKPVIEKVMDHLFS